MSAFVDQKVVAVCGVQKRLLTLSDGIFEEQKNMLSQV